MLPAQLFGGSGGVGGDGFAEFDNVALMTNPEGGSYADYRILIKDEYAPEMVVKAVVVENGNYHDDYMRIDVRNDNVVLNIDIDVTEDEYIPGELARVNLKCTDQFGAPVVANLSLSAVDEALVRPDAHYAAPGAHADEGPQSAALEVLGKHVSVGTGLLVDEHGLVSRVHPAGIGGGGPPPRLVVAEHLPPQPLDQHL